MEIVKLIGSDVLPDDQKLIIEIGKVIRVGFLQQNAFHQEDTFVPLPKQFKMMEVILYFYHACKEFTMQGKALSLITSTDLMDKIIRMKYDVANNELAKFDRYFTLIDKTIGSIR